MAGKKACPPYGTYEHEKPTHSYEHCRVFGWKAEYYDNKAHLTPRHYAIKTKLRIKPTRITTKHTFKTIEPLYKAKMIAAFYEAFHDSVEFCDWTTEQIKKHAWYRQESWRQNQLSLTSELAELTKQKNYWYRQL